MELPQWNATSLVALLCLLALVPSAKCEDYQLAEERTRVLDSTTNLDQIVIPRFEVREAHLIDVVDFIAEELGELGNSAAMNIYSAVQDLAVSGPSPERRVSLNLKDASLRQILTAIAQQLHVAYSARDGIIVFHDEAPSSEIGPVNGRRAKSSEQSTDGQKLTVTVPIRRQGSGFLMFDKSAAKSEGRWHLQYRAVYDVRSTGGAVVNDAVSWTIAVDNELPNPLHLTIEKLSDGYGVPD